MRARTVQSQYAWGSVAFFALLSRPFSLYRDAPPIGLRTFREVSEQKVAALVVEQHGPVSSMEGQEFF